MVKVRGGGVLKDAIILPCFDEEKIAYQKT